MGRYWLDLKLIWLIMLEPPWKYSGTDSYVLLDSWISWLGVWVWAVAGLALGAVLAQPLVHFLGIGTTGFQDAVTIVIAFIAGLLIQIFGWSVYAPFYALSSFLDERWRPGNLLFAVLLLGLLLGSMLVGGLAPLVAVGYVLYRYFTWVGPGQSSVTIAFVGALLVKSLLIPAIWGAIKSKAFQAFVWWLRGDKVKKA
jgi:hypothetical protein